jgi:undecaprenyl-diphosphatase
VALPSLVLAHLFDGLDRLERPLVDFFTCDLHRPWLEPILMASQSKYVAVPVLLGVIALLAWKRPRIALRALIACAAAWGIAMGLATILWLTIDRPRPSAAYDVVLRTPAELATCAEHPEALALRAQPSSHPSFPSRHGLTIGVFVTVLWLAWRPLGILSSFWGLLAAVGRVYAAKHWPSDVVVGVLLGVGIGWAVWRALPSLAGRIGARRFLERPAAGSGGERR